MEPQGNQISTSTLKLAILNLNSKLRRKEGIRACKLSMARDQNTGTNLKLDDQQLWHNHLKTRKHTVPGITNDIQIGDTVHVKNKTDKQRTCEPYIVTNKKNDQVDLQNCQCNIEETSQTHGISIQNEY